MIAADTSEHTSKHPDTGQGFPFIVDGKEFISERPRLTGAQIMERAGIPPEVGLFEIAEDGTQHPVKPDDIVELNRPHRFRRPPRFGRG